MKIKNTTSFWKNPFKWYRNRKIAKIFTEYINTKEVEEELHAGLRELMLKGQVIMKDGKVIRSK